MSLISPDLHTTLNWRMASFLLEESFQSLIRSKLFRAFVVPIQITPSLSWVISKFIIPSGFKHMITILMVLISHSKTLEVISGIRKNNLIKQLEFNVER